MLYTALDIPPYTVSSRQLVCCVSTFMRLLAVALQYSMLQELFSNSIYLYSQCDLCSVLAACWFLMRQRNGVDDSLWEIAAYVDETQIHLHDMRYDNVKIECVREKKSPSYSIQNQSLFKCYQNVHGFAQ